MKPGRALTGPAAVMAVVVVAAAVGAMGAVVVAAVAMEVVAVAVVATRTVIAVPRATTANRAGKTRSVPPALAGGSKQGSSPTVREGSELQRQESGGADASSSTLAFRFGVRRQSGAPTALWFSSRMLIR